MEALDSSSPDSRCISHYTGENVLPSQRENRISIQYCYKRVTNNYEVLLKCREGGSLLYENILNPSEPKMYIHFPTMMLTELTPILKQHKLPRI